MKSRKIRGVKSCCQHVPISSRISWSAVIYRSSELAVFIDKLLTLLNCTAKAKVPEEQLDRVCLFISFCAMCFVHSRVGSQENSIHRNRNLIDHG